MDEFAQYQIDTGKDINSQATDPLFNAIGSNDFRPVAGSPACTMSDTGSFVGALPCVYIDTDSDGMPDSFENLYGLDPDDPADANYHNDTDGLTNLQEYLLGTDPTNPDTDGDDISDESDICPLIPPVHVAGTYYSSVQTAYESAASSAIIQTQDTALTGNLVFASIKSITLNGGYECNYGVSEGTTNIIGSVTILNGSVYIQSGAFEINWNNTALM